MSVLLATDLPNLYSRGKVRDTYVLGDKLLMVATDRISAFDVVLPTGIPDKGKVLTQLSAFWFEQTAHLVPNHLLQLVTSVGGLEEYCDAELGYCPVFPPSIEGRALVVQRAEPLPVECVVRGYLSGSGWVEYVRSGTLHGSLLSEGLLESQKLTEPVFTPTTKAQTGHDQPLTLQRLRDWVGSELAAKLEQLSIEVYSFAGDFAASKGIIIADTKFEFGWIDGQLTLIDELLTPDSSRFWPMEGFRIGQPQPSYDKQFVRDWLSQSGWNREPPAPELPPDIVEKTAEKYRQAFRLLTGRELV